ncbi:C40 family peptidase [Streptomyces sp. FH025]|uniref:C40 family peptidase n=1 Tax=Streptomyces sp. FH025 TaxID=2815937 RepID=UPI001A9E8955|nr:C40 family peptidase [Streptomyces sp. FH025]MBO1420464.1 C40 family peptidase [Streptomyces sp. FH025]
MTTVNTGATEAADEPTGRHAPVADRSGGPVRPSRAARVRRGIGMAAVVAVGAGVIGLGTGVSPAAAERAPAHAGWDGSRYWYKNSQGQWRWTTHYDVYVARTGDHSAGPGSSSSHGSANGGVAVDRNVETAVQYALAQVGKPFRTAGNGPDGYDCSGLVQQSFRRGGIKLPRIANDQYAATTPISARELRRGDLLFWSPNGTKRGIQHVAIYLGDNRYVEAAHPGTRVRISRISSGYYPAYMGRP